MTTDSSDWRNLTLYRYRALNRHTLFQLINREVYFCDAKELNDPYDCRISAISAINAAISMSETITAKPVRARLDRLANLQDWPKKIEDDFRNAGVLSLSREELNVFLWSYCASDHSGINIGFRFSSIFTDFGSHDNILGIFPCRYSNKNPFLDFFVELAQADDWPSWEELWLRIISTGMLAKSEAWRNENEVRVIRAATGYVKYEPYEISEIIFGLRMSEFNKITISKLLSGKSWAHVKYRKVVRVNDGFDLAIVDA